MEQPFFSIVIPTKNRAVLVEDAIRSVLSQSFVDFELIIVDNDDTCDTQDVVLEYIRDLRLHYFRTGKLSMPANWEYGVKKATGKYLIILQDKMMLKPGALTQLSLLIDYLGYPNVIKWQHCFYNEETKKLNPNFLMPWFKPGYVDSQVIIRYLLDAKADLFARYAPIGIDTAFRMKMVKKFEEFCQPVSPDYTAAYQVLHVTDKVYCIPDMLTIMQGLKIGNGISFFTRGKLAGEFIKEIGMEKWELYFNTPIPVVTVFNSVINDYGKMYGIKELNRKNYNAYIYSELKRMEVMGVDVTEDLRIWRDATGKESSPVPNETLQKYKSLITNKRWMEMIRYSLGGKA